MVVSTSGPNQRCSPTQNGLTATGWRSRLSKDDAGHRIHGGPGQAQDRKLEAENVVGEGDFSDDEKTSDHKPILATDHENLKQIEFAHRTETASSY